MCSTQRRDNSGGVSVTARVCSTLGVRCMSSTVNLSTRTRRRPSICQTTRVHAASMAMIAICPSRSRSSLVLRTNQQTFTCTSFIFTRQLGILELQDLRLEPNVKGSGRDVCAHVPAPPSYGAPTDGDNSRVRSDELLAGAYCGAPIKWAYSYYPPRHNRRSDASTQNTTHRSHARAVKPASISSGCKTGFQSAAKLDISGPHGMSQPI